MTSLHMFCKYVKFQGRKQSPFNPNQNLYVVRKQKKKNPKNPTTTTKKPTHKNTQTPIICSLDSLSFIYLPSLEAMAPSIAVSKTVPLFLLYPGSQLALSDNIHMFQFSQPSKECSHIQISYWEQFLAYNTSSAVPGSDLREQNLAQMKPLCQSEIWQIVLGCLFQGTF